MENEKKILDLYVESDCIECALPLVWDSFSKPFQQDGYLYATDRHIMIRIRKNDCSSYPKMTDIDVSKLFPETGSEQILTLINLEKMLSEVEMVEEVIEKQTEVECEDCNGEGCVPWFFGGYEKEADCPVCFGTGTVSKTVAEKTGKMVLDRNSPLKILGLFFLPNHIDIIVKTMKLLEIDEVTFKVSRNAYCDQLAVVYFNDDVSVLIKTLFV
jgi:hypothetical protein